MRLSTGYNTTSAGFDVAPAAAFTFNMPTPGYDGNLVSPLSGAGTVNLVNNGWSMHLNADNSAFAGTLKTSGGSTLFLDQANATSASTAYVIDMTGWPAGYGGLCTMGVASGSTIHLGSLVGSNPSSKIASGYNGPGTITWSIGALGTDTTFAGYFGDYHMVTALTKVGTGKLTLTGANTYTGATTLTQGTLELVQATTFNSNVAVDAGTVAKLQLNSPLAEDSWTFAKQITDGSASALIEKVGAGSVTLSPGSNSTFAGSLLVSDGKLYLDADFVTAPAAAVSAGGRLGGNAALGATSVAAGGAIEGGHATSGLLTLDSLSFAGAGTVAGVPSATVAPIWVSGALTTAGGTGSVTVELVGVPESNGVYHLIEFGSHGGTINDFKFPSLARSLSLQKNGNYIDVAVNSANQPVWTGAFGSEWSTNPIASPKNWKLSSDSSRTDFLNLDRVVFPSVASRYTINVSATDVAPLSMTFNNDSPHDYTLGGSKDITGGNLVKNGSGKLTINGSYSFPGGSTLNSGTVVIGTETALGTGERSFNGGKLEYAGSDETWTRNTTVNDAGATLNIANSGITVTHNGTFAGSGDLTKEGVGTLILAGASSSTGGTTVVEGTLAITSLLPPSAITFASSAISVAEGAALSVSTQGDFHVPAPITGAGSVIAASNTSVRPSADNQAFTGTFQTENNGSYDYVNVSAGWSASANYVLNGAWVRFYGSTVGQTIDFGSLAGTNPASSIGNWNGSGTTTLSVGALGTDTTFAGAILNQFASPGLIALTKVGAGTLTLTGANAYTGATTVSEGVLEVKPGGGYTTTSSGFDVASGAAFTFNMPSTGYDISLASPLSGTGTVNLINNGWSMHLNADNSAFAGTVETSGNSTLFLDRADATSASTAYVVNMNGGGPYYGCLCTMGVADGSTIHLGSLAGATPDSKICSGYNGPGTITWSIGALGTDTKFAGYLADYHMITALTKVGTGTLTLSGASTYSGATTVAQGTLAVNNSSGSGTGSSAVAVQGSATLAGTGSIAGNVSIESGGFVAPGNAEIGMLTIATAALSGTYQCELDASACDQVVVIGELTVNPGATISVSTLDAPAAASYTIATYDSLVGGAPAVTGIPAGYVLDLATPGQVNLVKSSGGGFDSWADSFPGLTDKTPAGDPDKDGISNLLEYVIGGDPRVSSTAYLPTQKIVGTNLVLSYKRSDASETDTTQVGQWSSNLSTWTNIAPVKVNENDNAADDMTISIPLSHAVGGKLFGRLQVTKP